MSLVAGGLIFASSAVPSEFGKGRWYYGCRTQLKRPGFFDFEARTGTFLRAAANAVENTSGVISPDLEITATAASQPASRPCVPRLAVVRSLHTSSQSAPCRRARRRILRAFVFSMASGWDGLASNPNGRRSDGRLHLGQNSTIAVPRRMRSAPLLFSDANSRSQ